MNMKAAMYTQLQPWSHMGAPPCMERISGAPIPARITEMYKTPRPHPWRPTLGYEMVQARPLPSQVITNELCDACCTPSGVETKPLRYPNLVTGFQRNPGHAARTALYTRYTPCEWNENQIRLQNEANASYHYCDDLKNRNSQYIRETDEKVKTGQMNSTRLLKERISDMMYWEQELAAELEKIILENSQIQECMGNLQRAIQDIEAPLHITQECLYHREARKGNELVHDEPEQALLREVEIIRCGKKKLEVFTEKCAEELSNIRAAQHEIEMDISNKNTTLGIDTLCHRLNNFSRGLQYYGGIEKYGTTTMEGACIESSDGIVKKSQMLRIQSHQLQNDIQKAINEVAHDIWTAWNDTNNCLNKRISEILPVRNKLLMSLQKIQQEIFCAERNQELLKKAVMDKSFALKVAHTRLEARSHRPPTELCCDEAQNSMIHEVRTIKKMINAFNEKLQECEAQHQQLLCTRNNLESDLKAKIDALFIDREKVMGIRRSYPMKIIMKF